MFALYPWIHKWIPNMVRDERSYTTQPTQSWISTYAQPTGISAISLELCGVLLSVVGFTSLHLPCGEPVATILQ
jgi:hypothetical protein